MPLSAVAPLASSDAAPSPSETVLFGAARFAKKGLLPAGNDTPFGGTDKVSVDQLARVMLKAAILGSERAGALRIELRHSKAVFGLIAKTSLVLAGTDSEAAWPTGSLEAAVAASLRGREVEAGGWLYDHLGKDSDSPERAIVDEVRMGLGGRHAMSAAETKRLGFVTGVNWILTDAGERLRSSAQPEQIEALLAGCEHDRPQIWKALKSAIDGALARRTIRDSSGPDLSSD